MRFSETKNGGREGGTQGKRCDVVGNVRQLRSSAGEGGKLISAALPLVPPMFASRTKSVFISAPCSTTSTCPPVLPSTF